MIFGDLSQNLGLSGLALGDLSNAKPGSFVRYQNASDLQSITSHMNGLAYSQSLGSQLVAIDPTQFLPNSYFDHLALRNSGGETLRQWLARVRRRADELIAQGMIPTEGETNILELECEEWLRLDASKASGDED